MSELGNKPGGKPAENETQIERADCQREIILQTALRRLTGGCFVVALSLALLQTAACVVVAIEQFKHPPPGSFVTVDGVRLHYLSKGSGRPVVFIHGNDGMVQDFNLAVLPEAAKEFRAIAIDRPGHGYSQRESHEIVTAEVQARLIHDALGKLGVERPILVGHSWGGALALAYALKYPAELSGLVLLSPVAFETPSTAAHSQDYADLIPVVGDLLISAFVLTARPWVELNADQVFYPAHAPRDYLDTYTALVLRPGQVKAYAQDEITLNDTLRSISPHYGEIKLPVVIVTGDMDLIVPPDLHAHRLNAVLPNSSIIVIPGAGHQIELLRQRQVIEAINKICEQAKAERSSQSGVGGGSQGGKGNQ